MALISTEEWRSLEPLLDALLDLEHAERRAYLDSVCTDPAERERLAGLLVACERGEQLLIAPAESFAPLLPVPDVLGGRYKILRELGRGGMATVYLADDPKHGRQVAVKVLDFGVSQVFGDARFQQEIEIAARMQHPHILPLFDSGDADGLRYYVMPYVEGESLRDRLLVEKQMPVEDACRIAREVADAMDFAHRSGVVHRDIKPENILLHEGRSIVADFGIALAVSAAAGARKTETGLLIGTPHYMSPEQASGTTIVTGRSDIYSLGVVLYEMLAGEPPHTGRSALEVIAKIGAERVPVVSGRRKSVPPNVAAAVAKATEPLPADRFGSARDFASALADPAFRYGDTGGTAPRRWNRMTIALAGLTTVAAAVAAVALLRAPAPRPVARFDITPGKGQAMPPALAGVGIALSQDGSHVVYVGDAPTGGTQLWHRGLDRLEATPIAGTAGASSPALSPDGRMVAFSVGRGIETISLRGGGAMRVAAAGTGPTWGSDQLLYYSDETIIYRVASSGGTPEAVTSPTEGYHRFPAALPDGRGLLLTVQRGPPAQSRIAVVGPQGGRIREILTGTMARYSSSGHVVWATARGALMAAKFDLKRLEVVGPPVLLFEGVKINIGSASQFALSEAGPLLYLTEASDKNELVWVSRVGGAEPVDPSWKGDFSSPALSPDGTRLAVVVSGMRSADIWIKRLDGGPGVKLALDGSFNTAPTWTPDGKSVTYGSDSAGTNYGWTIRTARADGSAPAPAEAGSEPRGSDPRWSPDGEWLLFRRGFFDADVMGIRPGVDTVPVPVVAADFAERAGAISPDGRWLAYTSSETGRDEVYVRPFPNTGGGKWIVSNTGGIEPVWSHSGRELFYRNGQRHMVSVKVESTPTFRVGASSVLFLEAGLKSSAFRAQYDVTLDDQRFIMVRQSGGGGAGALILVLNLFEELKQLAR